MYLRVKRMTFSYPCPAKKMSSVFNKLDKNYSSPILEMVNQKLLNGLI